MVKAHSEEESTTQVDGKTPKDRVVAE